MSSDYDATEFIDGDFQRPASAHSAAQLARSPTPDEVDSKVVAAQQRLAELKREKEEVERERAALEETRRRQIEFQTGRTEVVQNLTRALGLLTEAEFNARRDAEQMAKALAAMGEALTKVQAIHEDTWSRDNFNVELTRALTSIESARMEWNSARLKFPVLSGPTAEALEARAPTGPSPQILGSQTFGQLCRLGLALNWPVALAGLLAATVLLAVLLRR